MFRITKYSEDVIPKGVDINIPLVIGTRKNSVQIVPLDTSEDAFVELRNELVGVIDYLDVPVMVLTRDETIILKHQDNDKSLYAVIEIYVSNG